MESPLRSCRTGEDHTLSPSQRLPAVHRLRGRPGAMQQPADDGDAQQGELPMLGGNEAATRVTAKAAWWRMLVRLGDLPNYRSSQDHWVVEENGLNMFFRVYVCLRGGGGGDVEDLQVSSDDCRRQ